MIEGALWGLLAFGGGVLMAALIIQATSDVPPKRGGAGGQKTVAEIAWHIGHMTEHERSAVLFICRRLEMGRRKYGPLNPHDGRDWLTEACEEMADLYVYAAAHALKEEKG